MSELEGKKLLIVGGAAQHAKLVEAARSKGVITYVVDYLPVEKAPAKQIADLHYEYNITDYEDILALCRRERIDGVLSAYLDACQLPYQEICERLGVPCFGSREQFHVLTDKSAFIEKCVETGMDVIPQYRESDFAGEGGSIDYPVLVKPGDSRGSRGQTVCHTAEEVRTAIKFAKTESRNGSVIIERFLSSALGAVDLQLAYFVLDGEPILLRVEDRYTGEYGKGLDRLCVATMAPSKVQEQYIRNVTEPVKSFVSKLGLKTAPLFLQGFMDGDKCRFYDPGLRLPGNDYDNIFYRSTGIDIPEMLVEFALTGAVRSENAQKLKSFSQKKTTSMLFPTLRAGTVARIDGLEQIRNDPKVVSVSTLRAVGDEIKETHDLKQRFCEIDLLCDSLSDLKETIRRIHSVLTVRDTDGENMLCEQFAIDRLPAEGRL